MVQGINFCASFVYWLPLYLNLFVKTLFSSVLKKWFNFKYVDVLNVLYNVKNGNFNFFVSNSHIVYLLL